MSVSVFDVEPISAKEVNANIATDWPSFIANVRAAKNIPSLFSPVTLASASSVDMKLKSNNTEACAKVGTEIAKRAKKAGVTKVVFDRGGYQYHGRVKALADAARAEGLEF